MTHRTTHVGRLLLAGILGLALADAPGASAPFPLARPNPNHRPAGRLRHDTLRVSLVVRMATWAPEAVAPPLELAAGVAHRFRFVNIGMAVQLRFSLAADSGLAAWRKVAKDGADLPPEQSRSGPAAIVLAVGETADASFMPSAPGSYRLTVGPPRGPVIWSQTVTTR